MYFVYVAAEDAHTSPVKIGITNNPNRRMTELNTAYPGEKPLSIQHVALCQTSYVARSIEQRTLERLRIDHVRIKGEMAHCRAAHAIGALTLAMQDNNKAAYESLQLEMFGKAA